MAVECRAIVRGRVQMVMFRDFAQRKARAFGLHGFVRNLKDGSVEVVAQGDRTVLDKFLEKLRHGSLLSSVESVESEWREVREPYTGFKIENTV